MVATQTTMAIDEVARVVATLPPEAQREVLDFALFLRARTSPDAWDVALESTTPEQVAKIRAHIASQRAQATPLFNEAGKVAAPEQA